MALPDKWTRSEFVSELTQHLSEEECRRELAWLIFYFRNAGYKFGDEGDDKNWTTAETAIYIMERYRKQSG